MGDDRIADVIQVRMSGGTVSMEAVDLSPGIIRVYMRTSPRGLRLSTAESRLLLERLLDRGGSRIYIRDTRKRFLRKVCEQAGWRMERAIPPSASGPHAMVATRDLPLDEDLLDEHGRTPDLSDTGHMTGISVDVGPRRAWAFYTDEGTTARIVSEESRRWGMFVCYDPSDIQVASDTLIGFLASAKKKWAVYSGNLASLVSEYHPSVLSRMVLDDPRRHDHSAVSVAKSNRREAVGLFSEYYDENLLNSKIRMRSFEANRDFSVYAVDGGFVVLKSEGQRGLIYDIYVTPSRQGDGLGDELLRCALSHFSGRAETVYLHTSYPRARRLYEKHGFREDYSHLAIRLDEQVVSPRPLKIEI